ncbi:ribbon-helix-helix domain-containing protein [uncultured Bacteroides sp.]|uniref:ribbon-helix-helix domain-containing protein n=1 Tax=uncultured Bacteroides sp. TaxID=162156 RepID=UPI002AA7E058|nr:ribbon-helix-helix domain-containing protein [uncultured Bacteroides sp.]
MKLTSMQTRITVRLDNDLSQNLDILHKATKVDKAKLVRLIMKDFFNKNNELLDKYYEETKTN